MFNLWARKREKPDFEYITTFENECQKYYMVDTLDESVYKEAIIVSERGCELYVEFPKPMILKKEVKKDGRNGSTI